MRKFISSKKLFFISLLFLFLHTSLYGSSILKTKWIPLIVGGITSIIPYKVLNEKPILTTTPISSEGNSVSVEINGTPGLKVLINGVYMGVVGANGKVSINIDLLGKNGIKSFSIIFEDEEGYISEALTLNITKITPETIPPNIQATLPTEGSIVSDELTSLHYSMSDLDSNIDFSSLSVSINGNDAASISSIILNGSIAAVHELISPDDINTMGLVITPTNNFLLPEGNFTVLVKISDVMGNQAIQTFHYMGKYDETSPIITMSSPNSGAIITDPLTPLIFNVHDDINGSGLSNDPVTITFSSTNITYALELDINNSQYSYTPSTDSPLPFGNVAFNVSAKDKFNNQTNQEFNIFLQEENILSAIPIATPSSAYAPATIRFSPKVTTDNAIQNYYWDFNGDGTYDRSDLTANSYTWQYTSPGDYNVTLKVVDANGEIIIGSTIVHILNAPPQITVESTPSNGAIPLTVNFTVTATDADGISLYEWDFDGDGVYDYNSTGTGNTSYTYTAQGVFNAQVKVTDNKGATTTYTTPTTKVRALAEGSPSVVASGSPLTGSAPLNVNFSATATDPDSLGFNQYEWDFDGDGIYDFNSSTSANTTFQYLNAGTFYPKIKVSTTDGRVTYDSLEIRVTQAVGLSVSTDTLDVTQGSSVNIHTTNTARGEIKIVIEDENYNYVRVIEDWTTRDAGSYDHSWDGMGANSIGLKEGKYYAVILYKVNEEIKKLDLRDSTGGTRYNPTRNNAPRSFAPFDNRPLKMTFNLTRASEVVSFMGYSYSNTRIITFRSRQPLGRGSYTDTWNAQNDEGVLITPPPGKWFMYGIWAFSLADNAIYVQSGAHVSAIMATPPIYTPDAHEADGKPATLKVHFNLNKDATIELEVFDAKAGVTVATRSYPSITAGEQTIEFDGRDNNGVYLHPGTYTLGIRAVDENGYRSIMEYTVTRIYY